MGTETTLLDTGGGAGEAGRGAVHTAGPPKKQKPEEGGGQWGNPSSQEGQADPMGWSQWN